nr:MAG TPA: Large polyvalent protein associated domain 29 [Caudoviricetes sp.]
MALYRATKNLFFEQLNKDVIVDDIIELEEDYAKEVNKKLKNAFPDVKNVLELVDKNGTLEPELDAPSADDASQETVED